MADAVGAKSPAKKRAPKPKKPASHPKYSEMIKKAIVALKERGGSSRQAIQKYILANFKVDAKKVHIHLKVALRSGVKNKTLKQAKGTGASGSFRIGDRVAAKKTAKKPKTKKPKTKKPKKVRKPKAAGTKKSPAKKSPKKPKKPKTPKKTSKPKTTKKPAAKKAAKKPASKSKKGTKSKK